MQTTSLSNAPTLLLQGLAGRKTITRLLYIVIQENMGFEH